MAKHSRISFRPFAVARAVAAILATSNAVAADSDDNLAEIIVTSTRRAENLQDVPVAITALTGTALQQLNVQTLDDFVRYLPNVSVASSGPGQGEVYMRGLSTTHEGNQTSGGSGIFPNVAIYLDDQSAQLPGRNLDVYSADLERIEVLKGPQGTLYGAGAQAGAVRYITNKPKLDAVEADFNAAYSATAHGDPNSSLEAMLNVPIVPGTFALRGVIYDDSRGGYIHNVPGTFTRRATDPGIVDYFNGVLPATNETLSNDKLVSRAFNPVTYKGMRLSGLGRVNDDWTILVQQSYQDMMADGVFAYDPQFGDLNVQQYNPSFDHDRFENTAWTVDGKIGALKALYTGSYLVRNVEQVSDYTSYSRGPFADYYQCAGGPVLDPGQTGACYSPSATWHNIERNTHQSHEIRISSQEESRVRFIGGLFWEDFKIQSSQNFSYSDPRAGFGTLTPNLDAGVPVFDSSTRPAGISFLSDITRGYKQRAVFGEVSADLVPKRLTLTVGTRFFRFDNYREGQSASLYGCRYASSCTPANGYFTASHDSLTNSGHKSRVNLSYKPLDDLMVYATYSEGFRPGGFNKSSGLVPPSSPLYGIFSVPAFYDSDTLKNYEIGWKTQWLDHRLRFDGALYDEEWSKVQMQIYDPSLYGNASFTVNGPNYRVRGVEADLDWRVVQPLTVDLAVAWNHSQQVNVPALISNGTVISLFPTAGLGSPLANAPPLQGSLRIRYEASLLDYVWHAQVATQYTAHSYADVVTQGTLGPPNYYLSPYSTTDAAVGISRDAWEAELFAENLTDRRANLFTTAQNWEVLNTVNRPRIVGLRFSYHFDSRREK